MAEFESNWDALAGAGGLTWRPLDVADTLGLVDGAGIVSVSTVGGLWTVTTNGLAGTSFWRFARLPADLGDFWIFYVRLTELAHPAAAQDIRAAVGLSDGANPTTAVGYTYPTGTTDLRAQGTLDNWGPAYTGASVPRVAVTEVHGALGGGSIWVQGGVLGGVSTYDAVDPGLGASRTEMFVAVRNDGPAQQTISFRPEYAVVTLGSIT